MSVLAKIRNLPLLRSFCAKKTKSKNALVREPNEVLVDIVACLDYVSIYALAWAGQPLAYFICAADQHDLLPRPREMTLRLRSGIFVRSKMLLTSNGFKKASIKIRETRKAQLSRNVARTVTTAMQKVLTRCGQRPVTHLNVLDVSKSDFEDMLRTCPALQAVKHLTCISFPDFVDYALGRFSNLTSVRLVLSLYLLADDKRTDHFGKIFQAARLRSLYQLEGFDEMPLPHALADMILDYLFDFSRLQNPEKFVRIDGTTFDDEFRCKLTKRLSDANETIAFVSASVRCYRTFDDTDRLSDVFVKERSQSSSFVATSGRKVTTIRRGNSFIITNNIGWLQQKLPALSFAS